MKNFIGNFLASLSAFIVGLVIVGFVNVLIFSKNCLVKIQPPFLYINLLS